MTVETPQLGNYHPTHLIAIIDSVRDKIIVKGLLKETKLNDHREALARANADIAMVPAHVRFSNRPFGVKRFQTIHHYNVDVAHGLALLFGIDARVLPSWDSRTRTSSWPQVVRR